MANRYTHTLLHFLLVIAIAMAAAATAHAQKFDFRAVHLIQGAGAVDVHFNGIATPTIQGLETEYMSTTIPGLPAGAGTVNVKVVAAGTGLSNPIISSDMMVASSTEYLGVAYGTSGAPKFKALSRLKSTVPAAGKALLRVLHAAQLSDSFDVYLGTVEPNGALFANVQTDSGTAFKSVDAVAATLTITRNGSTLPLAQFIAPLANLSYTTLVITGTGANKLKVYEINGALGGTAAVKIPLLEGATTPPTFIRAVNAWPQSNVPKVDIYFDGNIRTTKLGYRSASERYGPLTAQEATISFVAAGENPGTPLLTTKIPLHSDTGYSVVLTQFDNGGRTHLLMKRWLSMKSDNPSITKIRVANVTDFYGPLTLVLKPAAGDTVMYDSVAFLGYTPYRDVPSGMVNLQVFRRGQETPIYTGDLQMYGASTVTFLALGDASRFNVDILNDSVPTLQSPMRSFDPASGVDDQLRAGGKLLRLAVAPNPTSSVTHASFTLPASGNVSLVLYDVMGRMVGSTIEQQLPAGKQAVSLSVEGIPAGVYSCVVRTESGVMAAERVVVAR